MRVLLSVFLDIIIVLSLPLDGFVISDCFVFAVRKSESSAVHTLHKHSTTDPEIGPLFYLLFLYTSKIIPYLFTHPVYEFFVHIYVCALPVTAEIRRGHWLPLKLELKTDVSRHVVTGNRIQILSNSNTGVLLTTEPSLYP